MDTLACALDFTVFQSEVFQKQSLTLLSGWIRTHFCGSWFLAQGLHIYFVLFHFSCKAEWMLAWTLTSPPLRQRRDHSRCLASQYPSRPGPPTSLTVVLTLLVPCAHHFIWRQDFWDSLAISWDKRWRCQMNSSDGNCYQFSGDRIFFLGGGFIFGCTGLSLLHVGFL